ncbi:MAG: amidohydrolase [Hydrogenoanaerobacterium sp.]
MHSFLKQWYTVHDTEIKDLARHIFDFAETADEEFKSMNLFSSYLEENGFCVEKNVGNTPTAFRAVWGNGAPVIGYIAEYDALPGLNQKGGAPYFHGDTTKNGHGCGHNLLGSASVGAAVALKNMLEENKLSGTVVLYGTPSEETLKGKIAMARNGCFKELDCALSWHPDTVNRTGDMVYQAMDSLQISFYGTSSHAALSPELGRSALDAAELTNVGINYLREHVSSDIRIHYSYINAGDKPNIVPEFAKVWYFIRGKTRDTVENATSRVIKIAKGAAMMTETTTKFEFLTHGYETLVNFTLCDEVYRIMCEIGAPQFGENALEFAKELKKNLPELNLSSCYSDSIIPPRDTVEYICGSSDFSDISQIVPSTYFFAACAPMGLPLHHWSFAASAGSPVGESGMLFASRVLAECGMSLIDNPALLAKAKEEFKQSSKGWEYPETKNFEKE